MESRIHHKESVILAEKFYLDLRSTDKASKVQYGTLYLESRIHCMCGIRISGSGIRNPQHGIQDPRLSEITLHSAECVISNKDNVNITLHCMLVQCEMDGVQTGPAKDSVVIIIYIHNSLTSVRVECHRRVIPYTAV